MQHYPPRLHAQYGHQAAMSQMMMPAYQNAITVVAAPGEQLLTQPRLVRYSASCALQVLGSGGDTQCNNRSSCVAALTNCVLLALRRSLTHLTSAQPWRCPGGLRASQSLYARCRVAIRRVLAPELGRREATTAIDTGAAAAAAQHTWAWRAAG